MGFDPRRFALLDMLRIDFDERLGCYAASGPCVLMVKKPGALEDIYTDMTGGGGAWPCELVPTKGQADPSWRYVLINPHSRPPSILMVARGDKIADRLEDLLLNFDGIRRVDPTLYRDVASTCAKACQSPRANAPAIREFSDRHRNFWANCMWLPGENQDVGDL